ncbi:MAG: flagellar basal body protein, partial [Desulfocurvibacter africanus]
MDFMTALDVAASGLTAKRTQLNIISSNLANINTTRTAEGGPY